MDGMEIDTTSSGINLSELSNELIAKIFHSTSAQYTNDKKLEIASTLLRQTETQTSKKADASSKQKQQFFILNKEQFLLEWIINTIVKSATASSSRYHLSNFFSHKCSKGNHDVTQQPFLQEKYWTLLSEILSSPSLPQVFRSP